MALAAKHRSVIYAHLVKEIGEEAAEAMLSQFPARDLDEPVTKEFVRAEIAEVRTEIAELRGEMRTEMAELGNRIAARLQITIGIATGALGLLTLVTR